MTHVIREAVRRRRAVWLALLPVMVIAAVALGVASIGSATGTHPALSTFNPTGDTLGPNDVPGQKDLTMQGTNNSDESSTGDLWVVWAWDDTSVSGGNTLDACTLFDTNANGNVNVALCLTLVKSGSTVAIKTGSPVMYSCGDARNDRCTSTIASIDPKGSFCELETAQAGQFGGLDTQAFCDIKVTDLGLSSATNLLNTCSYPSSQPNSDPSDCVLVPGAVSTSTATTPSSTWSVTLKDSATVSPTASVGSNGTVTFQLFGPYADSTGDCSGTALWSSGALSLASGTTGTDSATGGSPSVSTGGYYKWKATYSGATGINGSDSGCGELQHVTAATITSS
jgi:hypothetical protein